MDDGPLKGQGTLWLGEWAQRPCLPLPLSFTFPVFKDQAFMVYETAGLGLSAGVKC